MNDLKGDVTYSFLQGPGRMVSGNIFLPLGTYPVFTGMKFIQFGGTDLKKENIWLHVLRTKELKKIGIAKGKGIPGRRNGCEKAQGGQEPGKKVRRSVWPQLCRGPWRGLEIQWGAAS